MWKDLFHQRTSPNSEPDPQVVNTDLSYVSGYATGDYGAVYNYPLYFVLKELIVFWTFTCLPVFVRNVFLQRHQIRPLVSSLKLCRTSLYLAPSRSQCLLWAIGWKSNYRKRRRGPVMSDSPKLPPSTFENIDYTHKPSKCSMWLDEHTVMWFESNAFKTRVTCPTRFPVESCWFGEIPIAMWGSLKKMRSIEHTILLYGHLCQLSTCDRPKVFFEADNIRSECRLLIEMSSRRVEKIVLCPVENLMEISAKKGSLTESKAEPTKGILSQVRHLLSSSWIYPRSMCKCLAVWLQGFEQ